MTEADIWAKVAAWQAHRRAEAGKERLARRLLHQRDMTLVKRGDRYSVVNHLGGPKGAPANGTIEAVLEWLKTGSGTEVSK